MARTKIKTYYLDGLGRAQTIETRTHCKPIQAHHKSDAEDLVRQFGVNDHYARVLLRNSEGGDDWFDFMNREKALGQYPDLVKVAPTVMDDETSDPLPECARKTGDHRFVVLLRPERWVDELIHVVESSQANGLDPFVQLAIIRDETTIQHDACVRGALPYFQGLSEVMNRRIAPEGVL
jgi:hypothetical protein